MYVARVTDSETLGRLLAYLLAYLLTCLFAGSMRTLSIT